MPPDPPRLARTCGASHLAPAALADSLALKFFQRIEIFTVSPMYVVGLQDSKLDLKSTRKHLWNDYKFLLGKKD